METQTLEIPVLWPNYFEDCDQCIERLTEALKRLDGMQSVTVNPGRRALNVTYDKELLSFEELRDHARALGVTIDERFRHETVRLVGLDCPDCAMKLETGVKRLDGVGWASVSFATSVMTVEYEPDKTDLEAITRRVREYGYDTEIRSVIAPETPKARDLRNTRALLTTVSGVLLLAGIAAGILGSPALGDSLLLLATIIGGAFIARSGILSLRRLQLDTNFLMTSAAIGAIILGEYSEAAAVMFLFSLGYTLETYTVDKTRRSIKSLIEAIPTHASVKRNGAFQQIPLEEIEVGETVLIKPGEKLPIDGTIISGESAVNEAPITGESIPKDKAPGDTVYAGSINGRGSLEVRTTSTVEDNTLARIIHLVEEAQAQKAPSQRFSETFGRYYTPIVIGLAVLIAILGPILTIEPARAWIERALTLLVVSCPCALVISTPVAIVAAIGNAAKSGILIKGGAHLEAMGKVTVVAFDKTGTLTSGQIAITDVVPLGERTAEDVISIAAAVESRSEHPLADAVIQKARDMGVDELQVSFFQAIPGKGAMAVVDGSVFYVGNKRIIEELSLKEPNSPTVLALLERGVTVFYVSNESEIIGAIGAQDTLKPGSADAISGLKAAGISRTIMLTGDTRQTAKTVADELSIDIEYSELLPEDKLAKIQEIVDAKEVVAMVGDGVNDAPALAAANVGIAMGAAGSHAAVEAADVALMADNLVMLPYAVSLSRRARVIIKQNIAIALSVVLFLVIGALMRWVNLATGVLGHEGSALLVILNSMRLLKR